MRRIKVSERKQIEISKEKIEEQEKYIEMLHRKNEDEFIKTGKRKSFIMQTFGCPYVASTTIS
ncbi:hypothetical protein HMPREF9998_01770 [Peptostreptococcus anaerobius VPI 4330 = DSM 2949]|nr:hypothetical protein HMPREF9998_01770 [Peptostreptococcus anaerobius VPI 4330 = DSM 2949]